MEKRQTLTQKAVQEGIGGKKSSQERPKRPQEGKGASKWPPRAPKEEHPSVPQIGLGGTQAPEDYVST